MNWKSISLRQFKELEGKTTEEVLFLLAENMTLTQFNNTDWSFLSTKPEPELPKKEYVINGVAYTPTLDVRKFTVSQYLTFINSTEINDKLNAVFNTDGVDFGDMNIVDVESIMYFFVMQLQTCIIGIQKYLKSQKKMNKTVKKMLLEQIASFNDWVFSYSSNR